MYLFFILQFVFLLVIVKQNTHHQVTKHLQIKNTYSCDCIHIATKTVLKETYASAAIINVQCMYLCVHVCCICAFVCLRACVCVGCACACAGVCARSQDIPQEWYIQLCVVCVHEVKVYHRSGTFNGHSSLPIFIDTD